MKLFYFLNIFLVFSFCNATYAQDKDVNTETVTSEQEYQATITTSKKINDIPTYKDSVPKPPSLSYQILPKTYAQFFSPTPIQAATIKGEPLTKLYRSFVKAGVGNYSTPYFDYFYNNLRHKILQYGVNYNFIGGNGNFNVYDFKLRNHSANAHLKYLFKEYTLNTKLNYGYQAVVNSNRVYSGITPLNISSFNFPIMNYDRGIFYNRWNFNTQVASNFAEPQKHYNSNSQLNYGGIANKYINEHATTIQTEIGKNYEKEYIHGILSIAHYYNNSKIDSVLENTVITKINPKLYFKNDKWLLDIGAKIAPVFGKKNQVFFYPDILANYSLYETYIKAYVQLTGDVYRNTFNQLTNVNPFVYSNVSLQNTNNQLNIKGGLQGHFIKELNYNLKVGYASYSNYAFYYLSESAENNVYKGFNVLYNDFSQTQVTASLEYKDDERLLIGLQPTFNINKAAGLYKVLYTPQFVLGAYAKYNLGNKLIGRLDVNIIQGVYGFNSFTANESDFSNASKFRKLSTIADVNLGLEYRYNKRLGAFVQFNNLGFQQVYRFTNVRNQSFNFIAGISYSF